MDIKLMLNEENIDLIVKYLADHPNETKALLNTVTDQLFEILVSPKTIRKGAGFYKALNKEINRKYWDNQI